MYSKMKIFLVEKKKITHTKCIPAITFFKKIDEEGNTTLSIKMFLEGKVRSE